MRIGPVWVEVPETFCFKRTYTAEGMPLRNIFCPFLEWLGNVKNEERDVFKCNLLGVEWDGDSRQEIKRPQICIKLQTPMTAAIRPLGGE